jgi:hypothetical protein
MKLEKQNSRWIFEKLLLLKSKWVSVICWMSNSDIQVYCVNIIKKSLKLTYILMHSVNSINYFNKMKNNYEQHNNNSHPQVSVAGFWYTILALRNKPHRKFVYSVLANIPVFYYKINIIGGSSEAFVLIWQWIVGRRWRHDWTKQKSGVLLNLGQSHGKKKW